MPVPYTASPNTKAKASDYNSNNDFFETLIDDENGVGVITVNTSTKEVIHDGAVVVDNDSLNSGTKARSLLFGGNTSGEYINSKRTAGGNQYGLDFYTADINVLSFTNAGIMAFQNDYSIDVDANGNWVVRNGGASGTIREVIVPTTGDINAALASVVATGTVTLLPGSHTVNAALDIDHGANVWLRGMGKTTRLEVASGISGIIVDEDQITVSDLTIDLNSTGAYGINVLTGANNSLIKNVWVLAIGENDRGIALGDDGAVVGGIVTNCHVQGTDAAGSIGILADNATGCIISGNYVKDNASDVTLSANSATCTATGNATDVAVVDSGAGNQTAGNVVF